MSRRDYSFWDLIGPYSYSPSRLNTALSLLLVAVWVMLAAKTFSRIIAAGGGMKSVIAFTGLAAVATIAMLRVARSSPSTDVRDIEVRIRKYD